MKPRSFLVDITVSMPKGESPEDWSYVGHLFLDVEEYSTASEVTRQLNDMIRNWCDKHPNIHDCMDNVTQDDEMEAYICGVCGEDLSPQIHKQLTLSSERRINARASHIVS